MGLYFKLIAPYGVEIAKFATTTVGFNSPSSNTFLTCLEIVDLSRWNNSVI